MDTSPSFLKEEFEKLQRAFEALHEDGQEEHGAQGLTQEDGFGEREALEQKIIPLKNQLTSIQRESMIKARQNEENKKLYQIMKKDGHFKALSRSSSRCYSCVRSVISPTNYRVMKYFL